MRSSACSPRNWSGSLPPSAISVVVCDAGPLIALGRLDRLRLLTALFRDVQVPQAVLAECVLRPERSLRRGCMTMSGRGLDQKISFILHAQKRCRRTHLAQWNVEISPPCRSWRGVGGSNLWRRMPSMRALGQISASAKSHRGDPGSAPADCHPGDGAILSRTGGRV